MTDGEDFSVITFSNFYCGLEIDIRVIGMLAVFVEVELK